MTAQNAINEVNSVLPHNFKTELLLTWLTRIEQLAFVEIECGECDSIPHITENDIEKELRIPDPFSVIYPLYLRCMIHLAAGEYDCYANLSGVYNSALTEYAKWHLRRRG